MKKRFEYSGSSGVAPSLALLVPATLGFLPRAITRREAGGAFNLSDYGVKRPANVKG